jgi:hypothetical protein
VRQPPPAGVSDPVLWWLATDVAAHHQPGPNHRCVHPFCGGAAWPCGPYDLARRAERVSRRPITTVHKGQTVAAGLPRRTPSWVATPGRAAVVVPLSPAETAVLAALGGAPAVVADLAGRTGLHPDQVVWALDRLAVLGLAAPLTRALPGSGAASGMSPPPYRRA